MQRSKTMLVALALLGPACRPAAPTTETAEPSAGGEASAAPVASTGSEPQRCPELAPREEAKRAFQDAVAQLEASKAGDHFIPEKFGPALARLREAAHAGHAKAQALLGATLFGVMFTNDAPQPAEREDYIESIAWLRTAAIAGDPAAGTFMPGLTASSPPVGEAPLSDVPAEWVAAAWQRADAWLACYGPPWTE